MDKLDDQIKALTEALTELLDKAKLCKDCNTQLSSFTAAIEKAEKVLEGKV